MVIVFRVDASTQIGTGHVIRCLTLSNVLRARGAKCYFICRSHEGNLIKKILQDGFEVIDLQTKARPCGNKRAEKKLLAHADWLGAEWQLDAEQTIVFLKDISPDWLIVDHYALDQHWESAMRPYCRRVMVIDDLADRDHDCDLLLDQNLVADMFCRYEKHLPKHSGFLLGPKYALSQPEYIKLRSRTPPRTGLVQHIFLFFGGADTNNLTGRAISAFLALNRTDIKLDVVINPISSYLVAIREQIKEHNNITLYEGLSSLAMLMLKADLAIGAGGATSWERCCLGLPSLVITVAENQKPVAAELYKHELVHLLGHQDEVSESMLTAALQELTVRELNPGWSHRCMALVDGRGAGLVSSTLFLDSSTELNARHARLEDEELLLQWANDKLVRQNAFNADQISPKTHRSWFYQCLRNLERCHIYIIETEDGLPVGQVRFELSGDGWEIHYALDVNARRRKIGVKFLETAINSFGKVVSGVLIFGRVKRNNLPSKRVFEGLEFSSEVKKGGEIFYQRLI